MAGTRIRGVAALVLGGALLVAGCSSGGTANTAGHPERAPSASTTGASPSPTAPASHRPWSDVNPRPRRAGDFVVKVLSLSRLAPGANAQGGPHDRSGPGFWQEEVRTCVRRSSAGTATVGWRDWRAVGLDGRHYPASAGAQRPAYPARRTLAPGACVRGWWLIRVPHDRPVRSIEFAPGRGGQPLIEWASMR